MVGKSLYLFAVIIFALHSVHISEGQMDRISGGHEAIPHSHPYIIVFIIDDWPSCDGTIITENWALTAGHCMAGSEYSKYYIVAGAHNRSKHESTTQRIRVDKYFVHPKYKGGAGPFDISVLKLKKPLKFNEFVQPVKLPEPGSNPSGGCTLVGWGWVTEHPIVIRPDNLMEINLTLMSPQECMKIDSTIFLEISNICTSTTSLGIGACKGDSGGPLLQRINGTITQIGIVSWGTSPCSDPDGMNVYTKVSSFIDFINETINAN